MISRFLVPKGVPSRTAARYRLRPDGLHSSNSLVGLRTRQSIRVMTFGNRAISFSPPLRRSIAFSSAPRMLARAMRVPAFGVAIGAGSLAYIDNKIKEATNYSRNLLDYVTGAASETFHNVQNRLGEGLNIEVPDLRVPEALRNLWSSAKDRFNQDRGDDESNSDKGPNGPGPGSAAAGAALALGTSDDQAILTDDNGNRDQQMQVLTRKMIEIRNVLSQIEKSETFTTLPSIIVIGSQSSGKSSVLEAVVGHQFLPKGSNMVTRRPIELTLVNTPDAAASYGEFPALGLGKITDFAKIQHTLTDLNLAVPAEVCVSEEPIQLNIYSRDVPDLTLIDLPGYIQIHNKDQPETLREKIKELCEKYIQEPNIILAVCSADVDLANSPALRASRRVDPLGLRTIGVVTKMDLVAPDRGRALLKDNNYPLDHGYIGVISKATPAGIFQHSMPLSSIVSQREDGFFRSHSEYDPSSGILTGTTTLKQKLVHVLEKTMAQNLQGTANAIRLELDETAYQFKVEFNDRQLTAESYIAESADALKLRFKEFATEFGKPEVRAMIKEALNQEVMNIMAERYWVDPKVLDFNGKPGEADEYWSRKLDIATSALTKLGVGRLSTTLITSSLISQVAGLTAVGPLARHPYAKDKIADAARDILRSRFHSTADQVENCIKPYKYDVEVEDREWDAARNRSGVLLQREIDMCREAFNRIKNEVGSKRLAQAMNYINSKDDSEDTIGFSNALVAKGKTAQYLKDREAILSMRMKVLNSRTCRYMEAKDKCPEIFLDVVAEKLAQTAVLFLNVELLSEFFYEFPREIDTRLLHDMSKEDIDRFAREDPRIGQHIDLQRKKELLEVALSKIESVIQLEKSNADATDQHHSVRPRRLF